MAGRKRYVYSSVSTVLYFVLTSIFTASFTEARYNFCTLVVMVAEKRKVLRCLGICVRIRLIYFSKSILSKRSASSKMRNLSLRMLKPFVFAK